MAILRVKDEDGNVTDIPCLIGPKGDTGPQGPKGETGAGLTVLDYYPTQAALEAAVTDPAPGAAYGVGTAEPYDIYIYGETAGWVNNGPIAAQKLKAISITLPAAGWDATALTQTAAVSGVSADETAQLIQPVPALSSQAAYIEAGILCTGQAADSLTFTAETVPTEDLTVYVVITEVTAG